MGLLPGARTETAVNGAPVNPNLVNEIQDVIIALKQLLSGAVQTTWATAISLLGNLSVAGNLSVTGNANFPAPESHNIMFAVPGSGALLSTGGLGTSPTLLLGTSSGNPNNLPLKLRGGTTLSSWSIDLLKNTNSFATISARLFKVVNGSTVPTLIGVQQTNSLNSPGLTTLGQAGLAEAILGTNTYFIELLGSGTNGDSASGYKTTCN